VILAHGLSSSKDDPRLVAVAKALAADGYDVLSYDARGHQDSGGLCTLGDRERLDVGAAVAWARERSDHVVPVGASMGAIAALRYGVSDPLLDGLVSVSCPAVWRLPRNARALAATGMTRTRAGRWFARHQMHVRLAREWLDPEPPGVLAVRLVVPLAVVHGGRDRFVAPREAVRLASAAPRARLILVPEMGHAFDPSAVEAIRTAVRWVVSESTRPATA
jgi:pimeloyl-ACP methyl ester carboxylesterase